MKNDHFYSNIFGQKGNESAHAYGPGCSRSDAASCGQALKSTNVVYASVQPNRADP